MRDIEPDPIQVIWDEFKAGGTPETARQKLLGRSFYVRAKPQLRPDDVRNLHTEILAGTPIAEVQRRFRLSRSHLYAIKRKLKLG